ncbi:hypothetical protein [Microvirus mar64]|uniref:Uncharacterized protein n=1 Tax=Microvirus mar64 TaxID=2851201 RepID=A0A8F5MJ92_9VIRU|nr:hypothetical protein [Microvirus mar64]
MAYIGKVTDFLCRSICSKTNITPRCVAKAAKGACRRCFAKRATPDRRPTRPPSRCVAQGRRKAPVGGVSRSELHRTGAPRRPSIRCVAQAHMGRPPALA